MSIVTYSSSITTSIPAAKLFKVLYVDNYNCLLKVAPQLVESLEKIQGSGGPGSMVQFNFAEGTLAKYAKFKVDVLDKDNLNCDEIIIEDGELFDKIELAKYEIKVEPTLDGGTINKTFVKHQLKDGTELAEEELKASIKEFHTMVEAVEAYILANPNV